MSLTVLRCGAVGGAKDPVSSSGSAPVASVDRCEHEVTKDLRAKGCSVQQRWP